MMMMSEPGGSSLSISVPPWPYSSSVPSGDLPSPYSMDDYSSLLQPYFPSAADPDSDGDPPADAFACDEFRMYEFKIRRCARGRSHDWTECPFAHPGEKARRRDPRKFHYSGTACPDFRKGQCKRGDSCEFAHGVFECWLHPARYRTQPCKDGTACRRRVCFFAHTPEQLRVLPQEKSPRGGGGNGGLVDSYDGSPLRRQHAIDLYVSKCLMSSSPTSTLVSPPKSPPSESPPMSPVDGIRRGSWPVGSPVSDVLASLRQLRLSNKGGKVGSWPVSLGNVGTGFGSPKGTGTPTGTSGFRPGFCSLPSTPTRGGVVGTGVMNGDLGFIEEEPSERVESGRALRERFFQRLSLDEAGQAGQMGQANPSVDWVSELLN